MSFSFTRLKSSGGRLVLRDRTNGSGSLAGCCEPLESMLKKENSLDSLGEW